jgi:hypothetical protein
LEKLECLFTGYSENTKFFEQLPNLENLILTMEDDTAQIRFDRIPKLRSLTLIDWSDISAMEIVSNESRAENLYLIDCELGDISPVMAFPNLTGLGFTSCAGTIDLSELQNLSRLSWFSFPPEVTQVQFSTILSQYQELKVVDLLECYEINDLSPLTHLIKIQELTLDVAVDDLLPLYPLTDMEVLILDEDSVDEE